MDEERMPLVRPSRLVSLSKALLAILLILFVVANDVAQSEYAQWSYGRLSFSSYYFLCWFTTSWLVLALPLYLPVHYVQWRMSAKELGGPRYWDVLKLELCDHNMSAWQFVVRAGSATFLNFSSTYIWYITLDNVPVAVNFALSHSEVLIVLGLSLWLLPGKVVISRFRLICFAALLVGLALVTAGKAQANWSSSAAISTWWWGVGEILLATFLWGWFEIVFSKFFGSTSVLGVMLFNSVMGALVLLVGGPLLPYFWRAGIEPVPDLSSSGVVSFLLVNTLFSVTYFVGYALALHASSPFAVSFTSILSVPAAALIDVFLWGKRFPGVTVAGMAVVFVSIATSNVYEIVVAARLARLSQPSA